MPKILPWRLVYYPCVDCGACFLPPPGSQRADVVLTQMILCSDCEKRREVASAAEIIACDHCGTMLPRSEMLYSKSYKVSQMICPDCYDTQHDPFDEYDPDDEDGDGWW